MRQFITTTDQIGQILRSARRAAGLSQAQAGIRLGLSQNRLSELEQGAARITVAQLLAMTALYNLQIEVTSRGPQPQTAW
ncbi:helix-turn-helix domain-containing protein [Burkholderia multivorans]|uniref:helix-turn-helix domain-containing protein n=1 Tax=Burkholderia multivorans TaxID=87883 RepID=UPI000D00DD58|nr:helix-turn-helix transcriptional regulator [Burkholderia multivorans]MBY4791625.1 helix-turn-helix domain-containing protein [Burkholderia multivorans]PRE59494.1 transcriptional regulator [Burkholderia multivorans]PRE77053.1 transcriptional regulator [Burkholderia multivorans]PRG17269.1 transcriptional regulator [Burkholderia multivorans]